METINIGNGVFEKDESGDLTLKDTVVDKYPSLRFFHKRIIQARAAHKVVIGGSYHRGLMLLLEAFRKKYPSCNEKEVCGYYAMMLEQEYWIHMRGRMSQLRNGGEPMYVGIPKKCICIYSGEHRSDCQENQLDLFK